MLFSRLSLLLLIPFAMVLGFFGLGLHSTPTGPAATNAAEPAAKAPTGFHVVALNGHNFTLPDGFTIELAAGPTLAERPVSGSFDDKGRLYVTDSSGNNDKAPEQAKSRTHRIRRLEDTNGDGVFDKSTLFVKHVALPQGALFYKGSLYVGAPPQILKFTDANDDGIADKEEIWFDGKTVGGCGNDVHGPWVGPDGWFYWTKGGFEKQEYTLPSGKKWSTRAAHVFRAKPDGTNIEPVMTGGMDNPVGLTFTPTGEVLVCGTFFQNPADGKRDGILHAVYGGVFGKDHSPIYEHPWTSPNLMPIMTHLGPAAPCALTRYQNNQFGNEYVDNLFCAQFNLRKISRHVLLPDGSTYKTIDTDFVTSDNRDFHPTDVVEDADGSLLVVDTGGWYKLCCPTSQLAKEDVFGAIYRVRKVGMHTERKTGRTYPPMANEEHFRVERGIVGIRSDDPHERRHAARLLGRTGQPRLIPEILRALENVKNDRILDHSLTYALIEIGDVKSLTDHLASGGRKPPEPSPDAPLPINSGGSRPPLASTRVRRAVLTALDQMPDGKLDAKYVLAELDSPDAALKETAWWIAGRHPEWGEKLAGVCNEQMKLLSGRTPAEMVPVMARWIPFLKSAPIREAMSKAIEANALDDLAAHDRRHEPVRAILQVFAKSGLKNLPVEMFLGTTMALHSKNFEVVRDAIAVLRAVPLSESQYADLNKALQRPEGRVLQQMPRELAWAFRATLPIGTAITATEAKEAMDEFQTTKSSEVKAAIAEYVGRAKLPADSLVTLSGLLKPASVLERPKLLTAFSLSTDPNAGLAFVVALSDPVVRRSLRTEQIKPILDKYPAAVKAEAEKLYALLAEDRKDERAKLDALIAKAPQGDPRRGQDVFNSAKAACIACHKIGYVGGNVGPDLRRIGAVRSERDLMEAIVFPSASFVRSYEPFRIVTADGKAYNGVLRKDAPDEVVVALSADQEVRIPRADIEEMTPSTVSVMPAGLDQQLSPQDLADVVAFLKANVR